MSEKVRFPELSDVSGKELKRRLRFYKGKSKKSPMKDHIKIIDKLYTESARLHDEFDTFSKIVRCDYGVGFVNSQVYSLMSKYRVYEYIEESINDVLEALIYIEEEFNRKYPKEDIDKLLPMWA